jgi:spore coat polysaccharide biosynthesis predicted glycosyltransferase SpsG/CMP-N-acetylneuraminic acid synthetase
MNTAIVIPAVKKNVAFTDDLVKKLAGISLIQRAIDMAKRLVPEEHVYVATDSEEICLICRRNNVQYSYKKNLRLKPQNIIENLNFLFSQLSKQYKELILLSPYVPLLPEETLIKALKKFRSLPDYPFLIPVKREFSRAFSKSKRDFHELLSGHSEQELLIESQAFKILSTSLIQKGFNAEKLTPLTHEINQDLIEIKNYQNWWVCEKLIKRKRIVFRVVGGEQTGMGHIYRALTLAHEITDHEVYFICDEKSRKAVSLLTGKDYWLGIYDKKEIPARILDLKPDIVINDILSTKKDYILKLRKHGIRVINFEDLGNGACHSDLTINELYEKPEVQGKNILWGKKYFFLREEFNGAKVNRFPKRVDSILVCFGGADPSDFTRKIFRKISMYCVEKKIKIFLVTGSSYSHIEKLKREIKHFSEAQVEYINVTGVMSHIMEQSQIAIAANGQTVYELAHMNIPSIILSHHEREAGHSFPKPSRGFIPMGIYREEKTETRVLKALKKLVEDQQYRRTLFERLRPFHFIKNKEKVVKLILKMLKENSPI